MNRRAGFTLLEIVLALAILAGALAALGEVMRLAGQNAELVEGETQAQVLAESVMAELLSGARPLSQVNGEVFNMATDPRWEYWITLEPTERNELLLVRVAVSQQLPPEMEPARYELIRWMLDPETLPSDSQDSSASSGTEAGTDTSSLSASSSASSSAFSDSSAGNSAGGQQR
jgi:type II secretion system protein I